MTEAADDVMPAFLSPPVAAEPLAREPNETNQQHQAPEIG
jgi:hypothetical protein